MRALAESTCWFGLGWSLVLIFMPRLTFEWYDWLILSLTAIAAVYLLLWPVRGAKSVA